jgi:hypothetical protein
MSSIPAMAINYKNSEKDNAGNFHAGTFSIPMGHQNKMCKYKILTME